LSQLQECNRCKAAGFPNQGIKFQKNGEDPATGKIRWKLLNEDGREHQHKVKQEQPKPEVPVRGNEPLTPEQQRAADIQRLHNENMAASKALTDAINRLAAAIEARARS
jgi:hypothetical protein